MADELRLTGVAEPPFRHLDLTIPKKTWLTVRGPVASGKNALIAKVVYGECQRRFLATLPPYWQEQLAVPPPPKLTRMTGAMPALLWRYKLAQANAGDETIADALGWRSAWQQLLASQGRVHCPVHQKPVTTTAALNLPELTILPEPEAKPKSEPRAKQEPSKSRFTAICLPELSADADPKRTAALLAACQKLGLMRMYRAGRLWPISAALDQGGALVADIVALTSAEQVAAATTKALATWTTLTRPGAAGEHLAGLGQTVTLVEAFPDLTAAAFEPPLTATAAGHCPVAGCGFAAALVPETGDDFLFAGQSYSFLSARHLSSMGYDDGLHLTVAAAAELLARHSEQGEDQGDQQDDQQGPARQLQAALTMGLGSLSLATPVCCLSAGQRQRLALCSAALCAASDYLVLLFYPSAHLDQQGIAALAPRFAALREQGNSLIVVDNHPALAAAAAQVLTLTPFTGSQPQTTWQALAQPAPKPTPKPAPKTLSNQTSSETLSQALSFGEAQAANPDHILVELAGLRLPLPLSGALGIAGPNGAGKSRLLAELAAHLKAAAAENHRDIPALRLFAPKAAPQSATTVASLLGIWQPLRLLYSRLPEAKALGITAKDFLASEYRCPVCSTPAPGRAAVRTTAESRADCTACLGSGLSHRLAGIRYRGHSLSQFLALTLSAAQPLVARVPTLAGPLAIALALPGLAELPLLTPVARLSKGTVLILQLAGFLAAGPRHKRVIVAWESSSFSHLHPDDREALHRASAAILADQGRGLIFTCTEPEPYHCAPLWLGLSRPALAPKAESIAKPADSGSFMPLSCQFFSHKKPL